MVNEHAQTGIAAGFGQSCAVAEPRGRSARCFRRHCGGLRRLVGYGVSLTLFVTALRHLGTARTGAYFSSAPFVGAVLGIAFLDEPVTWMLVAAGGLMALGLYLHLAERHSHEHVHEPIEHEHGHVHDHHHRHLHADGVATDTRHAHRHRHLPLVHRHPHYPDLHHRHRHR